MPKKRRPDASRNAGVRVLNAIRKAKPNAKHSVFRALHVAEGLLVVATGGARTRYRRKSVRRKRAKKESA